MDAAGQWKTEEYHGYDMHVCAQRRVQDNEALPGHGDQWDFTVRVLPHAADPDAAEANIARSDTDMYYSTQAIAENMGFLKGRELIEGRVGNTDRSGRTL